MIRWASCVAVLLAAGFATAAGKELHVVAAHVGHAEPRGRSQPGTALVTVDRPGKEVVLVVHAYNPVTWEVRATPKTTLQKVLAVGYHRQTVAAPNGVAVEEQSYDGKKDGVSTVYISGYYDIDSTRFRPFVRKLRDYTGLEVASFQGTYQFDPKQPFVVDAVQKDERLDSDFPKLTPAAQIPKFKFEGTRFVAKDKHEVLALFGEVTQAGPSKEAMPALPNRVAQVVYDPGAKQHYGITNHELHTVDVKAGTSIKLVPPAGINPNWLRALTFDAKRDRVIVSGRNAMYEYTPKNGAWQVLIDKNKGSFSALVWQKSTDTLFALREEHEGSEKTVPTLFELNAAGAVVKKTPLAAPMFQGAIGGTFGADGRVQLVDLGGDLAVLIHHEPRDSDSGKQSKPEAFLYVIDPATGKVKLAWKE